MSEGVLPPMGDRLRSRWAALDHQAAEIERRRVEVLADARRAGLAWQVMAELVGSPSRQHLNRIWGAKVNAEVALRERVARSIRKGDQ